MSGLRGKDILREISKHAGGEEEGQERKALYTKSENFTQYSSVSSPIELCV